MYMQAHTHRMGLVQCTLSFSLLSLEDQIITLQAVSDLGSPLPQSTPPSVPPPNWKSQIGEQQGKQPQFLTENWIKPVVLKFILKR